MTPGPAAPVVETENLVKRYGLITALGGVTLRVERGEIFGLLGQNGAGKTTLIKILLGIAQATAGTAQLLGAPAGQTAVRRRVGYLPEDHLFPDYHTGWSLLDFCGALLEMPRRDRRSRSAQVLDQVGLTGRMHSKIRTYSKGMKQRLGIAQAILHLPEVIFLDEPTDGVDPIGRREIRALLQQLQETGTTIFVNSHLLGEVELLCDRVAILQRGVPIRQGPIADMTRVEGLFTIGLAAGQAFPTEAIQGLGYRVEPSGEHWAVAVDEHQSIDPVVDALRARGLSVRHLVEKRRTLEELFLATVEAAEPGVDARGGRKGVER